MSIQLTDEIEDKQLRATGSYMVQRQPAVSIGLKRQHRIDGPGLQQ